MPAHDAERAAAEKEIERGLNRIFKDAKDPDRLRVEVERKIEQETASVFALVFLLMMGNRGFGGVTGWRNAAEAGAAVYGEDRGEAIGSALADELRSGDILTAERAGVIAVTETTAAISAGEFAAAEMTRELFGDEFSAVWQTANDDLVCPICGPLHGADRVSWPGELAGGPPAHPNCRCWISWE